MQIIGTPPYTYTWTNEGAILSGPHSDLVNVPSGNYYLKVTDTETCETIGGPYFVDQTGQPQVDDAAIVIIGANYGANNGISPVCVISGTEPLTYQWTDEANNAVGTDPESS